MYINKMIVEKSEIKYLSNIFIETVMCILNLCLNSKFIYDIILHHIIGYRFAA